MIQALAIHGQGCPGLAKHSRGLHQVFFLDAANVRHELRRVITHGLFQLGKAFRMFSDVIKIYQVFPQADVQHAVKKRHISARQYRQKQIRFTCGIGTTRIRDDDLQ
ncbi:hypothetical protein D3C81_1459470 [compost metagenome]